MGAACSLTFSSPRRGSSPGCGLTWWFCRTSAAGSVQKVKHFQGYSCSCRHLLISSGRHLYGNLHRQKCFFKLLIVHECFYTDGENVILLFVRLRSIFPNVHTSTTHDGCAEQPSRPSPTTTSPTRAEKLMICVFQHQALFDTRDVMKRASNCPVNIL